MLRYKDNLNRQDYQGGTSFVLAMDKLRRIQRLAIDNAIELIDTGEMRNENIRSRFMSASNEEITSIFLSQEFDKVVVEA